MTRRFTLTLARVAFAALTIVAMTAQAADLVGAGRFDAANYFSYFTIQSNVIGAAVFLVGAARWRRPATPRWDLVRGSAALNLTITYVVFALLLADINVDTRLAWVNTVVHGIFPIAVMADWLLDPPGTRITWRGALTWLIYPLVWLAYTMIRGPIAGWYPYPFLDPANGGYGSVALYVVGIFLFGLVVVAVLRLLGNALQARRLVPLATGTPAG
jgi:hypothetical protein